jgi:uncharacterized protein (TIGR03000 family)
LIVAGFAGAVSARTQSAAQDKAESKPVTLRVLLPHADAQLKIEGYLTRQTGTRRTFQSPPLEPGKKYYYTMTATWAPNNYTTITRTREVPVRAGQEIESDLRQADEKQPDKIVIRYVPTPQEVVNAMLKLGSVGKDDVVYDLGCGDGRIVIMAVKKSGAKRGVGVDIDPERIKESKANARQQKVDDRVEFRQGDVLQIKDLSEATVVMLYMSDELNLQLRPILRKLLKPGSRIVSHRFTMGDWKPAKTETITDDEGRKYRLHLWTIEKPAKE